MTTKEKFETDILDYMINDEETFLAHIPDFMRAAEEKIWYFIQLPKFKKTVTGVCVVGEEMLNLPDDFLAMALLGTTDGQYRALDNKDESYLREVFPDIAIRDRPRAYAQMDNDTIIVAPVPDLSYTLRMTYFYKPPSITTLAADGETWLSTRAYETLKYGALMEASIFMKMQDTAIFAEYEKSFMTSLTGLKNLGEVRLRRDIYKGGEK